MRSFLYVVPKSLIFLHMKFDVINRVMNLIYLIYFFYFDIFIMSSTNLERL